MADDSMDAKNETLIPAAEMARDNPVRFPHEVPNTAPRRPLFWPRRSSSGATSSASPRSAALCPPAAR